MGIMSSIVKHAGLLLALIGLVSLAGCSGTGSTVSRTRSSDVTDTSERTTVGDSLDAADRLYREALAHYVTDAWDEAAPLLERALVLLDGAIPETEEGESARASLQSRVCYFLEIVSDHCDAVPDAEGGAAGADAPVVSVSRRSRERTERTNSITIVRNDRVESWIKYFRTRGKNDMTRWLGRTTRYRPMIDEVLEEYGLPHELFYLAMIESGLNPNAYSSAHAAGMWQFISSRARMYELRVDWWVDERRDPEKATRAAAAYLSDLYDMFGCWELALAGYNSGEGRVIRARKKHPSCPDYWCLDLPRETENFVPKFMAAVVIGSDPEAYGFSGWKEERPLEYEPIEVRSAFDLDVIAEAAGTNRDAIKQLNPALRRWCTPSDAACTVYVPAGRGPQCLAELAKVPASERVAYQRHRIGRGETLSDIADAYGTSIKAIASFNGISNPHRIRAGEHVVIPTGATGSGDVYAGLDESRSYRVRRGDTVSSIARKFGKRTNSLLRANGLGWRSRIYPGDTLKIPM